MAVKLRLARLGRRHRPFFRINAVESRTSRNGRILEKLGHYDPLEKDLAQRVVIDLERVKYWLSQGAVPTDTVSDILLRHGIKHKYAEEKAKRRANAKAIARKEGKLFDKADKVAVEKVAEAAKVEAEAKAKAEAEEKAKAAEAETSDESTSDKS